MSSATIAEPVSSNATVADASAEPTINGYKLIKKGTLVRVRVNQSWLKDDNKVSRHKPILMIVGEGSATKTHYVSEVIFCGTAKTSATEGEFNLTRCTYDRHACVQSTDGVRYME